MSKCVFLSHAALHVRGSIATRSLDVVLHSPMLLPWRKSAWRTTSLYRIPLTRHHHPSFSPIGSHLDSLNWHQMVSHSHLPLSCQDCGKNLDSAAIYPGSARPFGFHYWRQHAISNRPVIDVSKGYYDPYTQVFTIPLQAGGDTDGGTIPTGSWTEKGDGTTPTKEWDITDDRVTD